MVVLIAGSSHTGKTLLAQRLLEKYKYPYLSIDHLKMGLIRSNNTKLTVNDDEKLTDYLWEIVKEIIKTNIENKQNIIIEGCYIPFNWKKDFSKEHLKEIEYICLIMTEKYINNNYNNIIMYQNVIEQRKDEKDIDRIELIRENNYNLEMCKKYQNRYILLDDNYSVDLDLK
ncbi:MAG: ATP-binding protein [Bacilli bacterium]|nr:ATP-binding protein [Bacilli bacterium]